MPLRKSKVSAFDDVVSYFKSHYKDFPKDVLNTTVIIVPKDLWNKSYFTGYGYLIRQSDLAPNKNFLEMAKNNDAYYKSLPSEEHKRDVNIYRISSKLGHPSEFIIIRDDPSSVYFLIHEVAHLSGVSSEFEHIDIDDEYMNSDSEQFAHLNEIRYAQNQGLTFEDYFKTTFPDAYDVIEKHEQGLLPQNLSHYYQLAKLDEIDYKKLWDYILKFKKTSAEKNKMKKIANNVTLSKENLTGKYGNFTAYVVRGNTYPLKNSLKQMGFRWSGAQKAWYITEKKWDPSIAEKLKNIGVSTPDSPSPSSSQTTDSPQTTDNTETRPTAKTWETENPEMTKWYGFPINKNIYEFDIDFTVDGEKHSGKVQVDRSYVPGKGSTRYYEKRSREYRGLPRYVLRVIDSETGEELTSSNATMKEKWGTYSE